MAPFFSGIVALRAVAYFLLASFYLGTLTSLASPVPSPLALVAPGDLRKSSLWNRNSRHSLDDSSVSRIPQVLTASDLGKRDLAMTGRTADAYRSMVGCYQGALASSNELSKLSGRSSGVEETAVSHLTSYKAHIVCMQSALDYLGRENGLANYDPHNGLETFLKDLVNMHKDTLTSVNLIISGIPGLGPLLAPIVFDIKCVLDDVLDALENLTDAALNSLSPLLEECIKDTLALYCGLGLDILGLCA